MIVDIEWVMLVFMFIISRGGQMLIVTLGMLISN